MEVEDLIKLLKLVPRYYDVYFETKTNDIALVNYIYKDEKGHNIILTDLPYSDYEYFELLKED